MSNVTPIGTTKATTDAVNRDCSQVIALSHIAAIADLVRVVCDNRGLDALEDDCGTIGLMMELILATARGDSGGEA